MPCVLPGQHMWTPVALLHSGLWGAPIPVQGSIPQFPFDFLSSRIRGIVVYEPERNCHSEHVVRA